MPDPRVEIVVKKENLPPVATASLPPVAERRFDSLARLITGADACGAATFAYGQVLLATNAEEKSQLIGAVETYLCLYAATIRAGNSPASSSKLVSSNNELMKIVNSTRPRTLKEYPLEARKAIDKLTRAINLAFKDPQAEGAWTSEVANALADKHILYVNYAVNCGTTKPDINHHEHAELKIVDYLVYRTVFLQDDISLYIGIALRCCNSCHVTMSAFNGCLNREALRVRDGSHNGVYPASLPALFRPVDLSVEDKNILAFIARVEKQIGERLYNIFDGAKYRKPDRELAPPRSPSPTTPPTQEPEDAVGEALQANAIVVTV